MLVAGEFFQALDEHNVVAALDFLSVTDGEGFPQFLEKSPFTLLDNEGRPGFHVMQDVFGQGRPSSTRLPDDYDVQVLPPGVPQRRRERFHHFRGIGDNLTAHRSDFALIEAENTVVKSGELLPHIPGLPFKPFQFLNYPRYPFGFMPEIENNPSVHELRRPFSVDVG